MNLICLIGFSRKPKPMMSIKLMFLVLMFNLLSQTPTYHYSEEKNTLLASLDTILYLTAAKVAL